MDKWTILGIQKTKDKGLIKDAYRAKLVEVNPEDDQEGFMRLRKAYEEALAEADRRDGESLTDDTPIGRWIQKAEEVYGRFLKRIQIEEWERILNDDLCIALDTKQEAMHALLRFLMDHCHLPKEIWSLLNDTFDWEERKKELYESYPTDYIDYVINGIRYEDILNYGLYVTIDDELDYDGFINCFHQLSHFNHNRETEEVKKALEKIKEFKIEHPYVTIERTKYFLTLNDSDAARKEMEGLINAYPEDVPVIQAMAEVEWTSKDYEKALGYYQKILALKPEHYYAKMGKADCYSQLDRLSEAREIYMDLLDVNRFDGYAYTHLMEVNDKKIAYYKENPDEWERSMKNRMEFAWCYFQREMYKESLGVIDMPEPEDCYGLAYHYLRGRIFQFLKEDEKSQSSFHRWLELYPRFQDEDGEEAEKNKKKIGIVYSSIGDYHYRGGNWEEALKYIELAITTNDENMAVYFNQKANVLKKIGKRDEAMRALEETLLYDERYYEAYLLRGEMYAEEERFQEAIRDYNTAIAIYPYYDQPYIKELEIYYDNNAFTPMKELIENAESLQVQSNGITLYKAKILRKERKLEEAVSLILQLLNIIEEKKEEEPEEDLDKYYQEASLAYYDNGQYVQALTYAGKATDHNPENFRHPFLKGDVLYEMKRYKEAIASFQQALKLAPENDEIHYRMAFAYREMRNTDKAIEELNETIRLNPGHRGAYGVLGDVYELRKEFKRAKECYDVQLQNNPTDYYHISRGLMHFMDGEFDQALFHYGKAKEYEPDNPYSYFNEGRAYLVLKRNQDALSCLLKAVELSKDRCPENFYRYLYRCYRRLEEWDKALECCDVQIKNKVWVADAYYRKSSVLKFLGRNAEALQVLKEGVQDEKANIVRYYQRMAAIYDEGLKKPNKAKTLYKKAIKKEPNNGDSYEGLAEHYFYHKSYTKAMENYLKAIMHGNDGVYICRHVAQCCSEKGKRMVKTKEKYIKKTMEMCLDSLYDKSEETFYRCSMVRMYILCGKLEEAKNLCEDILKNKHCLCDFCNYKDCHEAIYLMGLLNEEEGKRDLALEYYNKAKAIAWDEWEYQEAVERLTNAPKRS